mgnify:CR=1 FL=1
MHLTFLFKKNDRYQSSSKERIDGLSIAIVDIFDGAEVDEEEKEEEEEMFEKMIITRISSSLVNSWIGLLIDVSRCTTVRNNVHPRDILHFH